MNKIFKFLTLVIIIIFCTSCTTKKIEDVKQEIIASIPEETNHDLDFITKIDNYEITYDTLSSEFINNDGKIFPTMYDEEVEIKITIRSNKQEINFFVTLFIKGIDKEIDFNIDGDQYGVGEDISYTCDDINLYDIKIEDSEIIEYNNFKFNALKEGTTKIIISFKEYKNINKSIDVKVISAEEYANNIFLDVERYIKYQLPNTLESDYQLNASIEGYPVKITYTSRNESLMTNEGVVTRPKEDTIAYFDVKVEYKEYSKIFLKTFFIKMQDKDMQIENTKKWIDGAIQLQIANSEGKLPNVDEIYKREIKWVTDIPYAIDKELNILKLYDKKTVTLIAIVEIGGEEMNYKYKYESKDGLTFEQYLDNYLKQIIPAVIDVPRVNIFYNGNIDIIQDFVYPGDVRQIRSGSGMNGSKMPNGVQYVVIHDTGMTRPIDTAAGLNAYIHRQASGILHEDGSETLRDASWHFSIDDHEIYQHIPTDEIAWHAGDGSTLYGSTWVNGGKICLGGGNRSGIAIETCINPGNDYTLTIARTAKLVASLLNQYGIGLDRIKQHFDFSGKNCPNVMRGSYDMWQWFLRNCEFQLMLIQSGKDISFEWEIDKPEVIGYNGLVSKIDEDKEVNIKLKISIDGKAKIYEYNVIVKKQ